MVAPDDRRRFTRIPIEGRVAIVHGAQRLEVELIDLSLKGALTSCPADAPDLVLGTACTLTILLEGADRAIDMEGTIAHREAERIGFQCQRISMESMAQLRRLVELNLGDPALLERELERELSVLGK